MLAALVAGRPGRARTAGVALLLTGMLLGLGLFRGQVGSPDRFGCTLSGEDFVTLYAGSQLVLAGRGSAVYDVPQLTEARDSVSQESGPTCAFKGILAYWLFFLLPFFPLLLFPARIGYYLWTALTLLLYGLALWRLARNSHAPARAFWVVGFGFFPFVFGLLQGQMHGWQFLALTEFWLATRRDADRSAGVWLSMQMVKPQFLPLILLWLVWYRRWQVLGWFTGSSALWLGLTVLLAGGVEGVENYIRMMSQFVAALNAPVGVAGMVNLRAMTTWLDMGRLSSWGAIFALTALTAGLMVWSLRRRPKDAIDLSPAHFLALMAGTLLVGYDTHAYSVVLLLVPALPFLVSLDRWQGWRSRLWFALMDFTLASPTVLWILLVVAVSFTAYGETLELLLGQTLFVGLVGVLLAGLVVPPTEGTVCASMTQEFRRSAPAP